MCAVLELAAHVLVEGGGVGRGDGLALGVVVGVGAEGVEIWAFVAGVESTCGGLVGELEVLAEGSAGDAKVGAEEIVDRKAGVAVKLFGDGLLPCLRELRALKERGHIVAESVLLDLGEERLQGGGLRRQLVVVERAGGVGGQGKRVGLIDAGVPLGPVDAVVEAEDLREQDDAVEIDIAQIRAENGAAWRSVAFAEEVLGRVPAVVLGEEAANEAFEGVAVGIGAPEGLLLVLAHDAAEAGARGVDEDDIADVEEAVVVVDELVGRPSWCWPSGVTMRRGPKEPRCSHMEELPGPPL